MEKRLFSARHRHRQQNYVNCVEMTMVHCLRKVFPPKFWLRSQCHSIIITRMEFTFRIQINCWPEWNFKHVGIEFYSPFLQFKYKKNMYKSTRISVSRYTTQFFFQPSLWHQNQVTYYHQIIKWRFQPETILLFISSFLTNRARQIIDYQILTNRQSRSFFYSCHILITSIFF